MSKLTVDEADYARQINEQADRIRVLTEALREAAKPCECYSVTGYNSDGSEQDADVECARCWIIRAALSDIGAKP